MSWLVGVVCEGVLWWGVLGWVLIVRDEVRIKELVWFWRK